MTALKTAVSLSAVTMLAVLCMMTVMVPSEGSDADNYLVQEDDIGVSMSSSSVTLGEHDSASFWFDIKNNSDKDVVVYVDARNVPSGISVSYTNSGRTVVKAGEIASVATKVSTDALVNITYADIYFEIKIVDPDRGLPIYSNTPHILTVHIGGDSDADYGNKFLGIFENDLPSFLGESWFAAIVTFLIIISIGYIVCFGAVSRLEERLRCRK